MNRTTIAIAWTAAAVLAAAAGCSSSSSGPGPADGASMKESGESDAAAASDGSLCCSEDGSCSPCVVPEAGTCAAAGGQCFSGQITCPDLGALDCASGTTCCRTSASP
jgi:hypothetical protein